jgi:predicted enzyme related to lactoylglutathione lyase
MTDASRPLGPIMQILLPVTDLDRAVAFYEGVLDLPLLFRFPGNAFFDAHGARLYLGQPTAPGFDGAATIYFRVADVTAPLALLESRGASVRERPEIVFGTEDYDLWLAFVTDPDGNNIGLMREAPKGLRAG